jgi:Zonular occludens toxin (Zot).
MIDLYCGVPGSGKSCTALFDGIMHLLDGGVLATNFRLVSDWAERLADRSIQIKIGRKTRQEFIDDVTSRCFFLWFR